MVSDDASEAFIISKNNERIGRLFDHLFDGLLRHERRRGEWAEVECAVFVGRDAPRVLQAFFRVDVTEPDQNASRIILRESAASLTRGRDVTVDDEAVETIDT